jgi:hypothetical protein
MEKANDFSSFLCDYVVEKTHQLILATHQFPIEINSAKTRKLPIFCPYGTGWMTPTNDRREKYFALTDGMFSKYLCDKENIHRIWKTTNFLISDSPQGTYRGFQSLTL